MIAQTKFQIATRNGRQRATVAMTPKRRRLLKSKPLLTKSAPPLPAQQATISLISLCVNFASGRSSNLTDLGKSEKGPKENIMSQSMLWRKYTKDSGTEYSARIGPLAFWINDAEGDFDTVIYYGYHTETAVLADLDAAKAHCKGRAVALLQETLATVRRMK